MNFVAIFTNLLHNASALLGALFLYHVFSPRLEKLPRLFVRLVNGLYFAAVALMSMTDPVSVAPGVFFDLRGVIIGLATAYYGPITGGMVTAIVLIARVLVGGAGAQIAIGVAISTFVIGEIFYLVQTRRQRPLSATEHLLLGVLLPIPTYLWSFLLPADLGAPFREQVLLPLLITHPLATWAIGLIIRYQQRHDEMSEALEHERDLLRGLIEAVPDYIFVKDRQGRFILSNIAHARAARAETPDALIGKTAEQVFAPELAAQYRADDETVINSGKTITVERQTVDATGKPIWVTTIKTPLYNAYGKVIGVIGISRDITKRKSAEDQLRQSEARYRQIIETAHEGVWIVDDNRRTVFVNPHLAAMLGYTVKEIEGRLVSDFLAPEADIHTAQYLERRRQGLSDQYDSQLLRKDGTTLDVIISASPMYDYTGAYVGAMAMITDISDRKRALMREQELAFERERSKMMHSFISTVSHDFRTPLAILNTSMYLLRRITDPQKREERLNLIETQVNRLTVLLDAFTEVAQISDGSNNLFMVVEINEMVSQVVEMYQEAASRKQQQLTFTPAVNLPVVQGVPEHLQRVLREVLDNAVFYTPEGGQISVQTCSEASQVIIEVKDNGIGIDPEDMPHIFDYFYRADRSRQTTSGGPGLGLSIARSIIENHKGSIEVTSAPGHGSTFRICLPIGQPTYAEPHSSLMKWH